MVGIKLVIGDECVADVKELAQYIQEFTEESYQMKGKELNSIVVGEIAKREFIHGFNTAMLMFSAQLENGNTSLEV